MEGDRNTNQDELTQLAIDLASRKLAKRVGFVSDTGTIGIMESMQVRLGMWENTVEVVASCTCNALGTQRLGETWMPNASDPSQAMYLPSFVPFVDDVEPQTPDYPLFGTAALLLRAAAYYDPSLKNTQVDPATNQLTAGNEVGTAGFNPGS